MSSDLDTWISHLRESVAETTKLPTVLVPIEILEGESIPAATYELLANAHVVLLGYHVAPDQTPPGQARMQFEERATRLLDDIADDFEDAGAVVDTILAFTHNGQSTIDRVADQFDCQSTLLVNQIAEVNDVLLAVTPELRTEDVLGFVAALFLAHDPAITLVPAGRRISEADVDRVERTLVSIGFNEARITRSEPAARRPVARIIEAATASDVVVIAEPPADIETFILGDTSQRISDGYVGPVVVIHPRSRDDAR